MTAPPASRRAIAYRPDVDGLRAVAVGSVILFHMDEALLPGGFSGVDIFFVISGYLITSVIAAEMAEGRFSLVNFYIRRIKRLSPVLSVVLLATLLVGQLVMIPPHLHETAKAAGAAALSAANIFFVYGVDTGYFADDSATRPLLHIWSLGVEEQFYLVWPGLLLLLWLKLPRGALLPLLGAALAVAWAVSEWLARSDPTFAYYMLPSRAGELLIGAILVFVPDRLTAALRPPLASALAAVGAALVAYGLVGVDEHDVFPGLNAIPATAGTALLILAGPRDRLVAPLLSLRPVVWIGLLSYSLYLWHWPVLAFARYLYIDLDAGSGLALLAAMFALSVASYYLIEQPCRRSRRPPLAIFLRQLVLPVALVGVFGGALVLTRGDGWNRLDPDFAPRLAVAQAWTAPAYAYDYVCQRSHLEPEHFTRPACVINGEAEPPVLLWGDSYAAQYVGLLGALAKAQGFSFRNIAHAACPPVLDRPWRYALGRYVRTCTHSTQLMPPFLARYGTVIIGASWAEYDVRAPGLMAALAATVDTLVADGHKVILLGVNPRFAGFDRHCIAKAIKLPMLDCRAIPRIELAAVDRANATLRQIADARAAVKYVDFNALICPTARCTPYLDGKPLHYDARHISMEGSWALGALAASDAWFVNLLAVD